MTQPSDGTWTLHCTDAAGRETLARSAHRDGAVTAESTLACINALRRPGAAGEDEIRVLNDAEFHSARQDGLPFPGVDSMARWGPAASEGWPPDEDGRLVSVGDGLGWEAADGRLVAAARHHESVAVFVVPAGTRSWRLEHHASSADVERTRSLAAQVHLSGAEPLAQGRVHEYSSYTGDEAPADGEIDAADDADVRHDGRLAAMVVKVFDWIATATRPVRDPTMDRRLEKWREQTQNYTAEQLWKEVGDPWARTGQSRVLVYLHDALSSGLEHVREVDCQLAQHRFGDVIRLRFEHDTFLSITLNGKQLADALAPRINSLSQIVLVGHGRGGLVARAAANFLAQRNRLVAVCAFGTPHAGTPVVATGGHGLGALVSIVGAGLKALPGPSLATYPLKYLFGRAMQLPPGIAEMGSRFDPHDALQPPLALISYGGDATGDQSPRARRVCRRLGRRFFGSHVLNDQLVSLKSATAVGTSRHTVTACAHRSYFEADHDDLRCAVQAAYKILAVSSSKRANASSAARRCRLASTAPRNPLSQDPTEHSDHHTTDTGNRSPR